jgi:malonyl-CoA/methylmalonyl-CoA synthetase
MNIKDVVRLSSAAMALLVCVPAMAGQVTVYTPWPDHQIFALQDALDDAGDAEPALIVCRPGTEADFAAEVAHGIPLVTLDGSSGSLPERAAGADSAFINAERGPDDLATILYTSGTTGRSKGAMLSHSNLASNAEALIATWRYTSDDILIHALPIFHAHGLYVGTNVTLASGASMHFLPRFDAGQVIGRMTQATVMMGVPTFYTRLIDHRPRLTPEDVATMRIFISGSAPLLAETHVSFLALTGHAILERYGMTETGMNTSNPCEGDRVPGSVGLPLPGVSVRITDLESGRELAQGEVGMIEVKGPNVFSGYWRRPELNDTEFRPDGYFITGDIGRCDERGYLYILGRSKDIVITGGYNVYPKEVEMEIDLIDGVAESAIIGVPHPDFGEAVVAVIVPRDGHAPVESRVIEALRARLAGYKLPKRVLIADALPRNVMGKVQKNLLRDTNRDLFASVGADH